MSVFMYNKNNDKQRHTTSRITKEPKQKSLLGTGNNKITAAGGGGGGAGGRVVIRTSLQSTNPCLSFFLGSPDKTSEIGKDFLKT